MATIIIKKSVRPYVGWGGIVNYIETCTDIKQNICVGCGKGAIYDKNNTRYLVTWKHTLDEVKAMVEQIRKIN